MTSIGPQIPQHLLRQSKREEETNDEDSDLGPLPQDSRASDTPSIGPHIPASTLSQVLVQHVSRPESTYNGDDDGDDDDYIPALPPDLISSRSGTSVSDTVHPEAGPSTVRQGRRVLGPSLPGHAQMSYSDEGDSDDDDYGPKPSMQRTQHSDTLSEGVREFLEKEEKRRKEIEEASKPKKLKRDDWMLVPPSSSDLLGHLSDPLKLKARQFSRGGSSASRGQPNNLWTETPAERQQRIADEVAGKKRRAVNAEEAPVNNEDARKKRRRDDEIRRVVDEHNKSSRAKTLLELHSEKEKKSKYSKKSEDDESPPGIWDHDRDMSMGGRLMDEKQRGKLIADARSLGDRFGTGKAGGYL